MACFSTAAVKKGKKGANDIAMTARSFAVKGRGEEFDDRICERCGCRRS